MSTLNSFFTTRKSRTNKCISQNEKTIASTPFAIQAPQPIYDSLKSKISTKKLSALEQKQKQDAPRNSILHYLTSIKKDVIQQEKEEEDTLCKIRVNIPVSHVWDTILEEFDPTSHSNQFEDDDDSNEQDTNTLSIGKRTARLEEDDVTRNVRIRTNKQTSCLMKNMICMDDLYEDNEVLSRPLRSKHTLEETNDFLLLIANELLILSDNSWIIE